MKKVLMIVFAVLISVAFVTTVFSQTATDKATKAATDTAKEKGKAAVDTAKDKAVKAATDKPAEKPAAATEKKEVKKEAKPKVHQFTGDVTAIDTAAKTLNVKGKKDEKTFDIGNAKMKAEPKAGDKVLVKYTEKDSKNTANSVTVTKAAKKDAPKKDAVKKDEKPAATTAPAPAPAKK
jgi:hypothetical protein